MQKEAAEITLVEKIEEIIMQINGIKEEQANIEMELKNHHREAMKKLSKLREYQQIDDMNNQVLEQRLVGIEAVLMQKK